jgi:hypothetical protein
MNDQLLGLRVIEVPLSDEGREGACVVPDGWTLQGVTPRMMASGRITLLAVISRVGEVPRG